MSREYCKARLHSFRLRTCEWVSVNVCALFVCARRGGMCAHGWGRMGTVVESFARTQVVVVERVMNMCVEL